MKGKKIWTTRFYFERNELDSVAEFLEDKFAHGWEMTSLTGASFGFRKTEPKKVKVSVELAENDGDETEKKRFIEYCEADGWTHFFDGGLLQFFFNEDLDAEPIHTDEEVKLKLVHKKCFGVRVIFSLVVVAVIMLLFWTMYSDIKYWHLYSSQRVMHMVLMPLGIPLILISMGDYLLWYQKAKLALKRGLTPTYRRSKVGRVVDQMSIVWMLMVLWGGILMDAIYGKSKILLAMGIFFIVGVYLFIFIYTRIEAGRNQNRNQNTLKYLVIAIVFVGILSGCAHLIFVPAGEKENTGEPTLMLEELGVTSDGSHKQSGHFEGSPLVKYESGYERWGSNRIDYECYWTKSAWAYDMIVQQRFFDWNDTYERVDDKNFDGNEVYLMGRTADLSQWLLLYDEHIVYLETTVDLTDAQKAIIGETFAE